mgnify:CR=1 FL=1|jgi:cobalt-precorrin 5A hydrolase/precorrin-3B C17-methyltransferase
MSSISTEQKTKGRKGISSDTVYPIVLTRLEGATTVVVGGGLVGERKVSGLLAVGAMVRLISPEATRQLQHWADQGCIEWEKRGYQEGDLDQARLVFAATDHREVNVRVARDAARLGVLCNVVDNPADGDFHLPAVYRGEDTVIAVSTAGKSPTQARRLRDKIAEWLRGGI